MSVWSSRAKASNRPAPSGRFVALDMDCRHLRVVCAEPRRDLPRFRKLVTVDLPAELDLGDTKAVGRFIGESLGRLGLRSLRVMMDVPRSQAVLKTVSLPLVDDERELPGMVRYQVEAELPFAVDEAVIDFTTERQVHGAAAAGEEGEAGDVSTRSVLVAAVRQSVVDRYRAIAEAAEVRLDQLGLRPYADTCCLEACLSPEERRQTVALVHIDRDAAEINVLRDGMLAFSRATAVRFPDEASDGGGEAVESASDRDPVVGAEDLATCARALALEVARTLQSAAAVQGGLRVEQIFVAGDTGLEEALGQAVTQRLSIACRRVDPAEAMKLRHEGNAAGFITPLGLAVGHSAGGRMPLNFLDPKRPPADRNIRRLCVMAGGAAAAVVLLVAVIGGVVNLKIKQSRLDGLRDHYNTLERASRPVKALRRRVDAIAAWREEGVAWLDHWAQLSAALPGPTEAYVTSMKTNPDGSLALSIHARSREVITDLGKRLSKAGYEVKLGADIRVEDEYGYGFGTTVRLGVGPAGPVDVDALRPVPRPEDDGSAELIGRRRSDAGRGAVWLADGHERVIGGGVDGGDFDFDPDPDPDFDFDFDFDPDSAVGMGDGGDRWGAGERRVVRR